MKILQLITRDNNRSGSGVQMMELSIELARQGHNVTAVYKANPARDKDFLPYQDSGVNLQRIELKKTDFQLDSLDDILKIRSIIKNANFDLIHSHSNAVDHAFLASLGMKIPIIANRGMSTPLKWTNALKYKLNKISHIIAVSEDIKQVMHTSGGVPKEKISVIYGNVDTDRFHPEVKSAVSKDQLGINTDAFTIGYTGSIGGRKGINYLIDAFRKVHQKKPEAVLLLVGITDEQLAADGIILEPELKPMIKCVGFQHRPENFMALFDLFVFPGTRSEGLTGAIREAAAMAIPVITTDVGGNNELIKHQVRGLLVPPKNSAALSKQMLWMINNHKHAVEMAINALQFVRNNMTTKIRTEKVLALYKQFT